MPKLCLDPKKVIWLKLRQLKEVIEPTSLRGREEHFRGGKDPRQTKEASSSTCLRRSSNLS
jgi:hypothetical protein